MVTAQLESMDAKNNDISGLPRQQPPVSFRPPDQFRHFLIGQMAEWSNAHAWKACDAAMYPRVRIPLCPPFV